MRGAAAYVHAASKISIKRCGHGAAGVRIACELYQALVRLAFGNSPQLVCNKAHSPTISAIAVSGIGGSISCACHALGSTPIAHMCGPKWSALGTQDRRRWRNSPLKT